MKNYVLVMKQGNNYRIGLNKYSKRRALARQAELKEIGINMEVMTEQEAFGIE